MSNSQFEMVMNMRKKGYIKSIQVLQVLNLIDRGQFLHCRHPYEDKAESIGHNATISPPHMHALVLESLKECLIKGNRILDVGSGSGYLTACMATMVDKRGIVVGIEHVKEIFQASQANINNVMPNALKTGQIILVHGDGYHGYEAKAPYDAIHVGAAVDSIPEPLVDQLKPGGKMFIVVRTNSRNDQSFQIVSKSENGHITIKEMPACCTLYETLMDFQIQPPKCPPEADKSDQPYVTDERYESYQEDKFGIEMEDNNEIPKSDTDHDCQNEGKQQITTTAITINGYSYDVQKCLGEGGFGKVYKGIRLSDQKPVAIKVIENSDEYIAAEWSIPQMDKPHPHLLFILEHFELEKTTYLVTELLSFNFRELMKLGGGKFSLDNVKSVAKQLAEGYMVLYNWKIIHRDIKPENILVEETKQGYRLKLADFGCGIMLNYAQYAQSYVGTKTYMAVEVLNKGKYDDRADIWSMGLILYECFFGQHFYDQPSHMDLTQEMQVAPSGDKMFDDLLSKMLEEEYHDRMKALQYFVHPFHIDLPRETLIGSVLNFNDNL